MLADAAKGAGAVLLAGGGPAAMAAGVAAVAGHNYPVWLGFKGGKGVARTRFVSLGSIVATVLLPVVEWSMPGPRAVDIGATIVAVLILFRHRGNVARLWSRTERASGT